MRIDSFDYQQLLLADLDRKRRQPGFSPLVLRPTPAGLKTECAHVCKERFTKRDEPTLRAFFGPAESEQKYLKLIEGCPVDKFRPLVKYLKGETEATDDRNLELLAWLIDFRHRPFSFGKEVELTEEELIVIGKQGQLKIQEGLEEGKTGSGPDLSAENKISEPNLPAQNGISEPADRLAAVDFKNTDAHLKGASPAAKSESITNVASIRRKLTLSGSIMLCLILVICTVTLYKILCPEPDKGCMYWTGDHYTPMPCDQTKEDTLKLPMDEKKLTTFRRILKPDTITEYSIGKIYYIKINGGIEYYTAKGYHPIETTRSLKKLSRYIFDKYLRKP